MAIGKATEVVIKAYEGVPKYQSTNEPPKMTNRFSTDYIPGGALYCLE